MAEGGDGAFDAVACVKDLLAAMRNDVKLLPVTQTQAVGFLADIVTDAKDAEEVKSSLPEDPPAWVQMFAEAWYDHVAWGQRMTLPRRAHAGGKPWDIRAKQPN